MKTRLIPALCSAALLAALAPAASAVDAAATTSQAPTSPKQPKPRSGHYKVVKRGARVTRAKCDEGGNVFLPSREKAGQAQRARDIREACKNIDYTK